MRITVIGQVPPLRGGIAQHGGYLTGALARDHEVTVLSWSSHYPRALYRRAQIDVDAVPHPTARFLLRWWDPTSWWHAGRIARESDAVVLVWATPFYALSYRVVLALAGAVPTVVVAHNSLPHEPLPLQRWLTRGVFSRCDALITHASTVTRELDELLGGRVPITTIPMPAHLAVEPRPLPPVGPDGLHLLFFGFIRPYKGLDVALDALAALRRQGEHHHLTVVGEPWSADEPWARRVADRGLTDQVDLRLGYAADEEVSRLLADHHAVVLPYRSATQSGIAPVALAAGRPVIATRVGGIADVVHDGENGTLAAPGDPASLADAIRRCAADLPRLAASASTIATTWDDVAAAVVKATGIDRA
ncbi:MAG TPA: glycosyltransferase family 4 protein [Acidimicrobiales bacterium]|nr:glycosyltransferase family 4 protein [Acidimicrobiales bacterium]